MTIFTTIWLFLPAGFANMFAVISRHLPKIALIEKPVDFGKTWKGKRILGDGKTFRGFIFGTLAAIIIALVQYEISSFGFVEENLTVDYLALNPVVWGGLIGFGALFGDAVESLFKRRTGLKRGESWFPFDQTDYIIGSILFSLIYVQYELKYYFSYLFLFFIFHLLGKYLGYKLGIDDKPI